MSEPRLRTNEEVLAEADTDENYTSWSFRVRVVSRSFARSEDWELPPDVQWCAFFEDGGDNHVAEGANPYEATKNLMEYELQKER